MTGRRVAITGLGVVSPLGNDVDALHESLVAGRSGIVRLPAAPPGSRENAMGAGAGSRGETHTTPPLRTHIGARVDFDGAAHFPPPRLRMLDRVSQFALVAAAQAVKASGIDFATLAPERRGVFVGTGMGGAQTADDGYRKLYAEGSDRVAPYSVLMAMSNAPASWIGIEYGCTGPNLTYSTACSSSAVAIGEAARRIASGDAEVMLAGGAEACLNPGTLVAWDALKTLAPEDPEGAGRSCKPFAKDRSGLVLGEGAAVVVLEEWERAQTRGARIFAELAGYGLATDAAHITRPSVDGQAAAMRLALEASGLPLHALGYINAHGTATQANDGVETAAIKAVFGDAAYRIPVSSTKSMHGHLLGAAGALELVITVLALERRVLPPTINLRVPDPECDLDYIADGARDVAALHAAMTSSFAFGGTNAVLICRAP
jgi:3-oxoacyl-[acyl-carrier-protein] synthase II